MGEETNKLTGYLACVSRKLERPLAVMIQSSSAAGKSALMESILALIPEDERVQYSAMTGQSLFYMGETNLKHKILAIAEEEGASNATHPPVTRFAGKSAKRSARLAPCRRTAQTVRSASATKGVAAGSSTLRSKLHSAKRWLQRQARICHPACSKSAAGRQLQSSLSGRSPSHASPGALKSAHLPARTTPARRHGQALCRLG
ncbi:hypothetical protein ACL7TT_11070 [Microbulbifer sp. 2304DJ12-6]|uniref:hypothetical protein n=1 Tax=Microbulbifer sp. 2304DJ12-6 TaxID=3233340 RepID=UPI0039B0EA42